MADEIDNTTEKQPRRYGFQPGQSGNPAGRPKGARSRLGEDFLNALRDDFAEHGVEVVRKVRTRKPEVYLKIVADLMPKELQALVVHADADFSGLDSPEAILARIAEDLGQDMADAIADALAKREAEPIDVTPEPATAPRKVDETALMLEILHPGKTAS
jgi:hypothetical protein